MKTYGEKGHIQEGWIMHNQKKILSLTDVHQYIHQIYFQLVRTDDMYMLKTNWKNILNILFKDPVSYIEEVGLICKLILHTRDIGFGKGERNISYMMLLELYNVHELLAVTIFDHFVKKQPNKTCIGSWKDVKRFSEYIIKETDDKNHNFIKYMINISNIHLRSDYQQIVDIYTLFQDKDEEKIKKYIQNNVELTLVAKWLPRKGRDNRKYAWLFNKLADNMHRHYFKTVYTKNRKVDCKKLKRAIKKSEMEYRKMVSFVNKHLNVVEILQTSNKTQYINFNNVPSRAREQYHKSFLTDPKSRTNYVSYLNSKQYIHSNCYLYEIVKKIITLKLWDKPITDIHRQTIIKMWNSKKININSMNNIALVDMSCSMNDIPLFNSIALGLFIAEHNTGEFYNKLMTFGNKPSWITFNDTMDICDKVGCVIENKNNINSDLYSIFNVLINIVKSNCLSKQKLKPITMTILSDMQIDQNVNLKQNCLYSTINNMFQVANIEKPQIIFWNLKYSNGFPIFTTHKYQDVLMFSGYSEKILLYFRSTCKKSKDTSTNCNFFLFNMLSDKRYDFINTEIVNILLVK